MAARAGRRGGGCGKRGTAAAAAAAATPPPWATPTAVPVTAAARGRRVSGRPAGGLHWFAAGGAPRPFFIPRCRPWGGGFAAAAVLGGVPQPLGPPLRGHRGAGRPAGRGAARRDAVEGGPPPRGVVENSHGQGGRGGAAPHGQSRLPPSGSAGASPRKDSGARLPAGPARCGGCGGSVDPAACTRQSPGGWAAAPRVCLTWTGSHWKWTGGRGRRIEGDRDSTPSKGVGDPARWSGSPAESCGSAHQQ